MNTFFKKIISSKNSKAYCDRDFWLHCSVLLNKFFSLPEKPDEKGIWCLYLKFSLWHDIFFIFYLTNFLKIC